ncbi:PP2C family protein-serine/threonine phosphatase [Ferruginivarius sediminum]|nr:PP2C family serine/threonine-protein phosphatase [Ferruginivarius sediminum]
MPEVEVTARVRVHALTHHGAVRPHNEDTVAVGEWMASNDLTRSKVFTFEEEGPVVAVVADGLGGHAAGDVASRAAAGYLAARAGGLTTTAKAISLLQDCNGVLYDMMVRGEGAPGMGTTVVGLVVRGDGAIAFNVGDSRAYRFDGSELVQLSTDDTPGPKLENGRTAAMTTPLITQSLGGQSSFTEIHPHAESDSAVPGTRYLLCSDGLSDLVGADAIAARLRENEDAEAVHALFKDAMGLGGKDNISIVIVRVED